MDFANRTIAAAGRIWRTNVVVKLDYKNILCAIHSWLKMRLPKLLNPRVQKQFLKKFGVYDKVYPVETSPSRLVPDHIIKPDYVTKKTYYSPKVVPIKNENQINGMRESCKLAASILNQLDGVIKVGLTTDEIDAIVHTLTVEADAYPSPLHYMGFPKSVCTSVNNVAVHGIPDYRHLKDGDIINVDVTVFFKQYHGDCSKTFLVGNVDDKGKELITITEECLDMAIKCCGPGVPFYHIASVISKHAKRNHLTVLPAFLGHGIGEYFHGPPEIYHSLNRYPGLMKSGMTFTIEPVLSHGSEDTVILDDGWTVVTRDGARTAQVEHTVLVTDNGAEILTH